jgi:hypothetical protein
MSAAPESCRSMADPPRTANHTKPTTLGTSMTATTNSRMVRHFEMRAMNVFTNGAQGTHHD